MEKDVYLKDLNEPVRNYGLFADLNAGQTFHIRSSDKTAHYYPYLSLNCCLHTAESDGQLFIVVRQCFLIYLFFSLNFFCAVIAITKKSGNGSTLYLFIYPVEMYLLV